VGLQVGMVVLWVGTWVAIAIVGGVVGLMAARMVGQATEDWKPPEKWVKSKQERLIEADRIKHQIQRVHLALGARGLDSQSNG
jgi:hypothetical protein